MNFDFDKFWANLGPSVAVIMAVLAVLFFIVLAVTIIPLTGWIIIGTILSLAILLSALLTHYGVDMDDEH